MYTPFLVLVSTSRVVFSSLHPKKVLERPPTEEHGSIVGHAIEKKIVENWMLQQPSFLDVSTHFVYSFSFVKCPRQEETAHRAMPGRKTRGKKSEILSKYTKTPSLHQIEMILVRNTNSPRKRRAKKERKTNSRNDHRSVLHL